MYNEILKYQEEEQNLLDIDKAIKTSEERKRLARVRAIINEFETGKLAMDEKAGNLQATFEKLSAENAKLVLEVEEYQATLKSTSEEDEINYFIKKISQLEEKIEKSEKEMADLYNGIREVLMTFDELRKKAVKAKADMDDAKKDYEALKASKQAEIDSVQEKLSKIEKKVDKELFKSYKKVREQKIYPAIVPLNGGLCGGCRFELSLNKMSEIDSKGMIECEECGRLIFK